MLVTERTRALRVDLDGMVGLAELEAAALAFARSAPAQLVADTIESMVDAVVDVVVGPFREPAPAEAQPEAPWACTGCQRRQGFRRRGFRPNPRRITTTCGRVAFRSRQLECLGCGRRFAPTAQLLGLRAHQRRTEGLSELCASLAVEVAYAKTSRLLGELTGIGVSTRTIRRDVIALAPQRVGPEITEVPMLLLDGTGERAGPRKGGVALHLAIGLVARRRHGGRVRVEARLLGATLDESWAVMGDLLAQVRPGVIIVDGEPELSHMVEERFGGVPVQRCLWHLAKGVYRDARYVDRLDHGTATVLRTGLEALLFEAYQSPDHDRAVAAYRDLIVEARAMGARTAARQLELAEPDVFTFLTHPGAGRLLFGDKGRPELGTGVLERVMRELNRRTDVGVRWSIAGVRAILLVKLQHRYGHGRWSPKPAAATPPRVRFSLVA